MPDSSILRRGSTWKCGSQSSHERPVFHFGEAQTQKLSKKIGLTLSWLMSLMVSVAMMDDFGDLRECGTPLHLPDDNKAIILALGLYEHIQPACLSRAL